MNLLFTILRCLDLPHNTDTAASNIVYNTKRHNILMSNSGYYQLKMYWNSSYDWKDDSYDITNDLRGNNKEWCATCKNAGCDRGSVILTKCDSTDPLQRWHDSSVTKLRTFANNNGCLSYFEPGRMTIKPCTENNDIHQLLELKQFTGDKFQIQAVNHNNISSHATLMIT